LRFGLALRVALPIGHWIVRTTRKPTMSSFEFGQYGARDAERQSRAK
jgi:hypothetical protein